MDLLEFDRCVHSIDFWINWWDEMNVIQWANGWSEHDLHVVSDTMNVMKMCKMQWKCI